MTMHSFRVVTGMTGLIVVTTVLLVAQALSSPPTPFLGVTAVPAGAQTAGAAGEAIFTATPGAPLNP
jgi:hypothetical protein